MNLNARKSDCNLQVLNAQMMPVARLTGVIHLFEHDYVGFGFWHGVIDIEQSSQVKAIFEAGQHEDIKIRVVLPNGESGLAKQVFFRKNSKRTRTLS